MVRLSVASIGTQASAYKVINLSFSALLTLAIFYCWWFYPAGHPVQCSILETTGVPCKGCGLSRAVSAFVHMRFDEGMDWNPLGLPIFCYLSLQLIARWSLVWLDIKDRVSSNLHVIYTDIGLSLAGFAVTFGPLLY